MAEGTARTGPGWLQTLGPATTTVLLRHGETPLSGERRFAGRGDIPLTGTGLKQAAAAAARLAARGGLDLIVTSPLERTQQTASAVATATGVPLVADDGWMETDFGEWEGLNHAEAERGWPEQMAASPRPRTGYSRRWTRCWRSIPGPRCSSSVTSRR
jgi:probable phosphoglycerate mutase